MKAFTRTINFVLLPIVLALSLTFVGCGGGGDGSSGDDTGTGGLSGANSVTGTVLSANGDPIAGTTVYIPGVQVAAQLVGASRTFYRSVVGSDGTICEDPPSADSSLAAACTAADGTFVMDTSNVSANANQIIFQKGALRMVNNLECTADPCNLSTTVTTFSETATWPKVAAVTGWYDRIEDVLAKLADPDTSDMTNGSYGRVSNLTGFFVYGSEYNTNLTIIDGTGFLMPEENTEQISYDTWDSYFDGTNSLVVGGSPVFDIVFINCGNNYEFEILNTPDKVAMLQAYVNAGGRLYVTDLSYDFVEQPFPQVMLFEGDADDPNTPGSIDSAEWGTSGIILNAVVNNPEFRNWLKVVRVNRHDASTPGNPDEDCQFGNADGYEQITGALTSSDLIPIGDFLAGWARMVSAHTGESPIIWISSGNGVIFDGLENRPLTVSQSIGSNSGMVVYSSYHTAHSCPTTTFWPQERVLQYLIFETF